MSDNFENSKKKSSWGGARDNAGRAKGSMNKATKEQKLVEEAFRQRVLKSMENLINSQMNLAQGCQYLFCIHTETDKKGSKTKQRPKIVTNQYIIEKYLAGELDNEKDDYYFITTEKPDNKALDSLIDRVFGKATQKTEITGKDGGAIQIAGNSIKIEKYGDRSKTESE